MTVRDDFAGPGGWDEGLRLLGIRDVIGVEHDRWACETAVAAGHRRVQADVTRVPSAPWAGMDGYVASPPCTSFSTAGKGEGARVLAGIVKAAREVAAGGAVGAARFADPTTGLILEPLRVVRDLRPRWVALEQVPPCLPVWQEYARIFRGWGYCATARVLCAADFGVPQTRRRAILVARLDGPALLPEPTHDEHPGDTMFGQLLPWVSMAEALGWGFEDIPDEDGTRGRLVVDRRQRGAPVVDGMAEPCPTITAASFGKGVWRVRTNNFSAVARDPDGRRTRAGSVAYERPIDEPAPTLDTSAGGWTLNPGATASQPTRRRYSPEEAGASVCGDPRVFSPGYRGGRRDYELDPTYDVHAGDDAIRISPQQAAILQSFPPDYPWQGGKSAVFRQVGNAVPPRLAAAVIGALLGIDWQTALDTGR